MVIENDPSSAYVSALVDALSAPKIIEGKINVVSGPIFKIAVRNCHMSFHPIY